MLNAEIFFRSSIPHGGYVWVNATEYRGYLVRGRRWNQDALSFVQDCDQSELFKGKTTTSDREEDSLLIERDQPHHYEEFDWYNSSRNYDFRLPLECNTTLYREFASISRGDRSHVLDFASKYGCLNSNRDLFTSETGWPGPGLRRRSFIPMDQEIEWYSGCALMRSLIRLWEAPQESLLKDGTLVKDRRIWAWKPSFEDVFGTQWDWWVNDDDDKEKIYHEHIKTYNELTSRHAKNRKEPWSVQKAIWREFSTVDYDASGKLEREVKFEPKSHWNGTESLEDVTAAAIRQIASEAMSWHPQSFRIKSDGSKNSAFQIVPSNLFQALLLQFWQAYAENKEHIACPVCGNWFEQTARTKDRRKFCSEACKARVYRGRKQQASELYEQGKSLREIADHLDASVKTIKGWLKKPSTKPRKDS